MKKSLLFLLLPLLGGTTLHAYDAEIDGIYYNFSGYEATVTSGVSDGGDEYSGTVAIPESFTYNDNTYSVISIGEDAFRNCTGLASVTIPNSVTTIGNYAFSGCSNLTSIVSLVQVPFPFGEDAFSSIPSDCALTVPEGTRNAYIEAGWTTEVFGGGITEKSETPDPDEPIVYSYTYRDDNGIEWMYNYVDALDPYQGVLMTTTVTNENIETLSPDKALPTGISLFTMLPVVSISLSFADDITEIPEHAFFDNSNLSSVHLPASVTSIGSSAFGHCGLLSSVHLPASVTSIGSSAFGHCGLESIVIDPDNQVYTSRGTVNGIEETECNAIIEKGIGTCTLLLGCNTTIIPEDVTAIGAYAFSRCDGLTSVTIPASVTSIGQGAFDSCSDLSSIIVDPNNQTYTSRDDNSVECNAIIETATNILIKGCGGTTVPETVSSIAERAFAGCNSLISISIPEGVTSLGVSAFDGCGNLTTVSLPSSVTSISAYAFSECVNLTSVIMPNVSEIDRCAFRNCNSLEAITLPASLTAISTDAFWNSGLTSIVVDDGNDKYDSRDNCNAIIETATNTLILGCGGTTIPETVNRIESHAFEICSNLTSITIPSSITSMGYEAFIICSNLTSVISEITEPFQLTDGVFSNIPNECTLTVPVGTRDAYIAAGWNVFTGGIFEEGEEHITEYDDGAVLYSLNRIDNTATVIWKEGGCSGDIIIPETIEVNGTTFTVTSISEAAFGENDITSITIPETVTSIGHIAFNNCWNLTSVSILAPLSVIHGKTFTNCGNLETINIPETVSVIEEDAFFNCSSLTSICIPESVTDIRENAFWNCSSLTSLSIPASVASIGRDAFADCSGLTSIIVDAANENYTSRDENGSECNGLIEKSTGTLLRGCAGMTIPENVEHIGSRAFSYCRNMVTFDIPENVLSIGKYAFLFCEQLAEVTIPATLTEIGYGAFECCWPLTTVAPVEESSSAKAFRAARKRTNDAPQGAIIPETVTYAGERMFAQCNNLPSIYVDVNNTTYTSRGTVDGVAGTECNAVIEIASQKLVQGCNGTIIPDDVSIIGSYAFFHCSGISSVTLPAGLTSIEASAFEMSPVTLVRSLKTEPFFFSESAFSGIPSNCVLIVPDGTKDAYLAAGWTQDVFQGGVYEDGDDTNENPNAPKYVDPTTGIVFTPIEGSENGVSPSEGYESVCDGDTETKFGMNSESLPAYVIIEASEPVAINGYTIITANDNADEHGRNPMSWTLEGSSNLTDWTMIDNVVNDMTMQDVNYTPYDFYLSSSPAPYTYFRFTVSATQTAGTYMQFSEIHLRTDLEKPHLESLALVDGEVHDNSLPTDVDVLMYSRTYRYSAWLPWYVPFDLVLTDDVLESFSFAKFCGTYTEEDEQGEDVFYISVSRMKEGDIVKANTPYVVKAVTASNEPQVVTVTDAQLNVPTERGFSMYSAEKQITIQGIYSTKTATAEDCDWYFINNTGYVHAQAGQTLGSYRYFLTITDREDNPYAGSSATPNNIKMKVLGEDDDATGVELLPIDDNKQADEIYDLSGRRISNNRLRSGIYIINGKKVFVR